MAPRVILLAYYVVTFLFGIAGQFFAPVLGATIPLIVPRHQLVSANALFNLTFTAAQSLVFAAAGPVFVKIFGIDNLFIGTVVLYLVRGAGDDDTGDTGAGGQGPERRPRPMVLNDIKEGLIYILRDPQLMRDRVPDAGPDDLPDGGGARTQFISGVIGLDKEDIGYIVAAGWGCWWCADRSRVAAGWLLIDIALTLARLMLGGLRRFAT